MQRHAQEAEAQQAQADGQRPAQPPEDAGQHIGRGRGLAQTGQQVELLHRQLRAVAALRRAALQHIRAVLVEGLQVHDVGRQQPAEHVGIRKFREALSCKS